MRERIGRFIEGLWTFIKNVLGYGLLFVILLVSASSSGLLGDNFVIDFSGESDKEDESKEVPKTLVSQPESEVEQKPKQTPTLYMDKHDRETFYIEYYNSRIDDWNTLIDYDFDSVGYLPKDESESVILPIIERITRDTETLTSIEKQYTSDLEKHVIDLSLKSSEDAISYAEAILESKIDMEVYEDQFEESLDAVDLALDELEK